MFLNFYTNMFGIESYWFQKTEPFCMKTEPFCKKTKPFCKKTKPFYHHTEHVLYPIRFSWGCHSPKYPVRHKRVSVGMESEAEEYHLVPIKQICLTIESDPLPGIEGKQSVSKGV